MTCYMKFYIPINHPVEKEMQVMSNRPKFNYNEFKIKYLIKIANIFKR